jgi:hypothetical protein
MAYNADGLQLLGIGGAIAETFPTAGTVRKVYSYVTNDALATILADGYFDGINGDPLAEGDLILCAFDIDGERSGAETLYVTVGGGDVTVVPLVSTPFGTATTSGTLSNAGVSTIGSTTGALVYNLEAPAAGVKKIILRRDAGTTGPSAKVSSTGAGATFDGTNDELDFALGNGATGIAVELVGISSTRWQVVSVFPGSTYVLIS